MTEMKALADKATTFDALDIRLGQIESVELATNTPKPAYVIRANFGKFGQRQTVGRFTQHTIEELKGQKILGVLNFESRQIGEYSSEFLLLGVQYPKAESGEATLISPLADAKIGGKLF